jgi:hypothetical protein
LAALLVAGVLFVFVAPEVVAAARDGVLAPALVFLSPAAFGVALLLALLDGVLGFRGRGFLSVRSLLEVAALGLVMALVTRGAYREYRTRKAPPLTSLDTLEQLVRSKDAQVRALVVELAGHRERPAAGLLDVIERGLSDQDPRVRLAAEAALERRAGHEIDDEDRAAAIRALLEEEHRRAGP